MRNKEEAACEEGVVHECHVERVRPKILHELLVRELCVAQSVCHFGHEFRSSDCCTHVFDRVRGAREPPGGRLRREQLLLVEEELLHCAPTLGELGWREAERELEERVVGVPRAGFLVKLASPQDSHRMAAHREARGHRVQHEPMARVQKGQH